MLNIHAIPALKDNYIWLLINSNNGKLAVVDPGEAEPVLDYLSDNRLEPTTILITHHHWDHVNGIRDITHQFSIPVITPAAETVTGSSRAVSDGESIELPDIDCRLNVMHVPGHTLGAVAYYNDSAVFSGDTLFSGGCGRMFEGTAAQMHASLNKFKQLPDSTLLYCGHEYSAANLRFAASVEPENVAIRQRQQQVDQLRLKGKPTVPTTLAVEKATNPFLRCDQLQVADAVRNYLDMNLQAEHKVFGALRTWKDNF